MPEKESLKKPFIDYSQWSRWDKCEWDWYEHYKLGYGRKPKEGPKDDALTLGSLVHAGLESFRRLGRPDISKETIIKANASHECVEWALKILTAYTQTYAKPEPWKLFSCESPLRFDIRAGMDGLAKLDYYFHVEHPTTLETGLGFSEEGVPYDFALTPGWWIREYKTKDPSKSRGNYLAAWRMNMQADFQMLALQELIEEPVQGLLVDVLEKPKPYTPKRTCKGCRTQFDLKDWIPTGEGYRCSACGNVQALDTSDKSKVERKFSFYRFPVTRTQECLERSRRDIKTAANRMLSMLYEDVEPRRSKDRCVDSIFGPCEYFKAHAENVNAEKLPSEYVQIEPFSYVEENTGREYDTISSTSPTDNDS